MLPKPLCLLPLVLIPLRAQESPDDLKDLQAALERPIAVASKRVQRLKEAPADATVLTGAELEALGYATLGEALEGVLGFRTNRDRAYDGLAVRGLYLLGDQNTRVLILLDGHALNSPAEVGSSKVGRDFGIPLERVERIEVVRGPASSLYGNNAFLGMVNIVTRRVAAESRHGLAAAVEGGNPDSSGLWADAGATLGPVQWNLLAQGFQRKGESLTLPDLSPAPLMGDLDREEAQSAYLRAQGPAWSFHGLAMSRTQRLITAPFGTRIGSALNQYRNRLLTGDLRWEPHLGRVGFLVRLFGDRNEFGSQLDYDGIRTPGTTGLFRESDPDRATGVELQARFPMGPAWLWTVGTERQWHHYGGSVGLDGSSPVTTATAYTLGNTYLQGEWTASDSLSLLLGAQAAAWQIRSASQDLGSGPIPLSREATSGVTPRLAVVWRPSALDILKVLFGQGYRNPTIFERYYSDGILILNNPSLRPERIWSTEGIWIRIWGNGLQTQLAATRSRWSDQVYTADAGGGQIQARNESAPIEGSALEAEVQGTWPGWVLKGSAGLYRWERNGQRIDNSAPLEGALRLTRHQGPWSLSGEARFVGSREAQGIRAPGALTFRAVVRGDFRRLWTRLVAEDLGDRRREDLVARDYAPVRSVPGGGRAFRLEVGVNLP
jgi:outer membrane receptor for ferrienterochelin and colicins